MGYEEEAEAIAQAAAAKDREGMAKAFSDRIAEDLFVIGTEHEVVARLREYVDAGGTIPVVAPLAPTLHLAAETLKAIGEGWTSSPHRTFKHRSAPRRRARFRFATSTTGRTSLHISLLYGGSL